eukprot:gnl/TRDRNA2_/TRDRNA2_83645_c0_seq1.p1 gnl/TRDRNA2_/TRDRNA2_83645_c0~~gnl/TRDRNA2_/TRDRNA2_83645_c0_seq1.p1  ORF type:complete len:371 (+),score=54.48 gnl/TRDRNA2_/TRDRNA2_83645_c0_seq1:185-1297(+)
MTTAEGTADTAGGGDGVGFASEADHLVAQVTRANEENSSLQQFVIALASFYDALLQGPLGSHSDLDQANAARQALFAAHCEEVANRGDDIGTRLGSMVVASVQSYEALAAENYELHAALRRLRLRPEERTCGSLPAGRPLQAWNETQAVGCSASHGTRGDADAGAGVAAASCDGMSAEQQVSTVVEHLEQQLRDATAELEGEKCQRERLEHLLEQKARSGMEALALPDKGSSSAASATEPPQGLRLSAEGLWGIASSAAMEVRVRRASLAEDGAARLESVFARLESGGAGSDSASSEEWQDEAAKPSAAPRWLKRGTGTGGGRADLGRGQQARTSQAAKRASAPSPRQSQWMSPSPRSPGRSSWAPWSPR